jgi:hypothetical protein
MCGWGREILGIAVGEDNFLYSPFPKTLPHCNIPNGNQRGKSWALIWFSYRNPLEENILASYAQMMVWNFTVITIDKL